MRRVLLNDEKLEFVKTSVSWIQGKDIMDTCFILNYGFEAPLPWPQVYVGMVSYNFDNIDKPQTQILKPQTQFPGTGDFTIIQC